MMLKLSTLMILLAFTQASSYKADIEKYRQERARSMSAETGWTALTDLRWLDKNGQFTVGRGTSNAIVLKAPSAPDRLGMLTVDDRAGQPVTELELTPDAPAAEAVKLDGLTLGVIERAGRRALRVWDRLSPARQHFQGLRWYPIDERWRLEARFIPHQPAPMFKIQNIVGQIVEMSNPGAVAFTIDGREYRLEALLEEEGADELFFMFRDATSGKATYGAGRYLYTPLPRNGRVTLDFNRAVNPPCAFTEFATCPLPPAANRLTISVEAGERDYRH
jgi:uncharacterized protein (DUF1684 family)